MSDITGSAGIVGVIDHLAVAVSDADRAAADFQALLGYRVVGDEQVEAAGVRLVYLAPADQVEDTIAEAPTTLQLVQPIAPGKVADFLSGHGEGPHHICFRTTDIERALRHAGRPHPDVAIFIGGGGRPCAFLSEQPHGVLIEFTQTPSAPTIPVHAGTREGS